MWHKDTLSFVGADGIIELKLLFIFSCNKPVLMDLLLEKQFLSFICLLQQNASVVAISSMSGPLILYSAASTIAIWTPIKLEQTISSVGFLG